MIRRVFSTMLGVAVLTLPFSAKAQEVYDDGIPYVQQPVRVTVDYSVAKNGDLTIQLTAQPEFRACGKLSGMPVAHKFDTESVDIEVKDFTFFRPLGNDRKDCGAAIKVARSVVTLSAKDMDAYDVQRVRLWYAHNMDSYLVNRAGYAVEIVPPIKTNFFDFGKKLDTPQNTALETKEK